MILTLFFLQIHLNTSFLNFAELSGRPNTANIPHILKLNDWNKSLNWNKMLILRTSVLQLIDVELNLSRVGSHYATVGQNIEKSPDQKKSWNQFHEILFWPKSIFLPISKINFWTGKKFKNARSAISRKKIIWFHEFICLDFFKFSGPLWSWMQINFF